MAKRKQRFKFHGKCSHCAGPIMDWRKVEVDYLKKYAVPFMFGEDAPEPRTRYCEGCRYMEAADRLDHPKPQTWGFTATQTGRMSASRPNLAQLPRAHPKQGQRYASK